MDNDLAPPPPPTATDSEPVISDLIDITVKTIDSKNFQFQVENDIQIKTFKERIATQVGIDPESQRMIFCGRVLADDKTLQNYSIDNGKTIHLVKKAGGPAQRNNTNTASNANQQNDQNRSSRQRFHSYRSEDGSVFMGTISLDTPSSLINQMVRQIFTGNRANPTGSGEGSNAAGSANAASETGGVDALRNRVNHIRRFLNYINTNFQILENPNQFPTPAVSGTESAEAQQVLASEYTALFREALAISDRIRPHLNNYFQSLASQPSESDAATVQSNHSILMRITHHLSHVMHLLSEFNVDLSMANMPLTLNILDGSASSTSSATASNNPSSIASSMPNVSARIEISTPTMSSTSLPRMNPVNSGALFGQAPIVLMEVDTNINVSRNFMQGLRNLGSMSSSMPMSNADVRFFSPGANPAATAANQSNSNSAANNTTSNSTNSANAPAPAPAPAASNPPTGTTPSANVNQASTENIDLGSFPMSIIFDPYLHCNSTYTIPEVRSAANVSGISIMQEVVNSLGEGIGAAEQSGSVANNPLFAGLQNLFQNVDNSNSTSNSTQSSDEFEFFDLIRFLINQITLNGGDDLTGDLGNTPRIVDYLRNLNLFRSGSDNEDESIISDLFNVLFENLNFEDLLHIVNSDFHEFGRFRQPLQNFIRSTFQCPDWSLENIRSSTASYLANNLNSLITVVANIPPAQGVDPIQSFQNFVKETFSNFLHMIMSSTSDESFENDLMAALKYLVSSYIQFCRACFADSSRAVTMLITNYFEQYANYMNPRIRSYIINIIVERINSQSSSLEIEPLVTTQIEQCIVHTDLSRPSAMQVEIAAAPVVTAAAETDAHSVSDSEVEFSDAISDFPSTSATPKVAATTESNEQLNWETIVPNDWVPIINEDISKQKNVDSTRQSPFSDAYLNGMPKKRRLEHKPEDDEQKPDPKLQRPQ